MDERVTGASVMGASAAVDKVAVGAISPEAILL